MWYYNKATCILLFFFIVTLQGSCDFEPLYKNPNANQEIYGYVHVLQINNKEGFHLREDLVRRFGNPRNNAYILEISINTSRIKEVITPTNEITSYRLVMTANYVLKNSFGKLLIPKQITTARTGFSSASNSTGYATQVAEEAAKKRLAIKIGENINTQLLILKEKWFE